MVPKRLLLVSHIIIDVGMDVLAMMMAPASSRIVTISEVYSATRPARPTYASEVTMPSMLN